MFVERIAGLSQRPKRMLSDSGPELALIVSDYVHKAWVYLPGTPLPPRAYPPGLLSRRWRPYPAAGDTETRE